MQKNRKNGGVNWEFRRNLACIWEYVSLSVMLCSLFICMAIAPKSFGMQKEIAKFYVESQNYESDIQNIITDLYRYLRVSLMFETDREYDPNKVIDITEYLHSRTIPGELSGGLLYRLGDLVKWGQKDLYETRTSTAETEFQELYKPIGYDSIEEYARKNHKDAGQLYQELQYAVKNIWEEIWQYNKGKAAFAEKHSNLKYNIYDGKGNKVLTNTNLTDQETKELGTYVVMDYSNLFFETNLKYSDSLYKSLQEEEPLYSGEVKVVIGIDTMFRIHDSFFEMKHRYDMLVPWWGMMAVLCGVSLLLWKASISYLTHTMGRGKQGIPLKRVDRMPFEVLTLLMLVTLYAGVHIAVVSYKNLSMIAGLVGGLIGIAGIANGMFMVWYCSVVRRIKRKSFGEYSYVIRLYKGLKNNIEKPRLMTKVLVWYGGFLLVNFLCIFIMSHEGSAGIILILILDLGVGIIILKNVSEQDKISKAIQNILKGEVNFKMNTQNFNPGNKETGNMVNALNEGMQQVISENLKNERMKTDLITNVSHDIKTPLTSIINYVGLMKKLLIQDERASAYLKILDNKSQRLKLLTEDLLEASKISSGMLKLEYMNINFKELVMQTNGEFLDKFMQKGLELIVNMPEFPVIIRGDSRRMWRVLDNLYTNADKYAQKNTRIYVDVKVDEDKMYFFMKNVSEQPLNIDADELTERFVRGDLSRTTEGSGLGLSISKSLVELQNGEFGIYLDGDLFKVTILFPLVKK